MVEEVCIDRELVFWVCPSLELNAFTFVLWDWSLSSYFSRHRIEHFSQFCRIPWLHFFLYLVKCPGV